MNDKDKSKEQLIDELNKLRQKVNELEILENQQYEFERQEDIRHENLDLSWAGNLGRWDWDYRSGKVIFNKLKVETLGYDYEAFEPHVDSFTNLLHPDDFDNTMNNMKLHLQGKIPVYEVEYRIKTSKGNYKWFYDRGKVVERDENGKPIRLTGIVFEIDEKKKAEQILKDHKAELEIQNDELIKYQNELELSQRKYFNLFDLAPISYFTLDHIMNIVDLNSTAMKMIAVEKSQTIGKSFTRYVAPDSQDVFYLHIQKVLTSSNIESCELEMRQLNGKQLFTRIESKVLNNSPRKSNKDVQIQTAAIDITQSKIMQRALKENESKYRTLFENANDAIFLMDTSNGIIFDANPKALELLKIRLNELKNMHLSQIFPEDKAMDYAKLINDKHKTNANFLAEMEIVRSDGKIIPVEVSSTVFMNNLKVFSMGIYRDISERKAAEERITRYLSQLKESNATKDKFFSIIAHDLKNPFNYLLSTTELLAKNYDDMEDSKIKNNISSLHDSTKQIYNLLENLLQWSRAQRGQLKYEPMEIDFYEITYNTVILLNKNAKKKDITIDINLAPDLVINADYKMLMTIVRNLISNAIKFSHSGGKILVSGYMLDNALQFTVEDSGIGMSDEISKNLFKIDKSISRIGTDNEEGTGLGLILCKEFVDKHNGSIEIDSKPDKGTSIKVILPQ